MIRAVSWIMCKKDRTQIITVTIKEEQDGLRIDKALMDSLPDLTRSALQNLIRGSYIKVGAENIKKSYKVKAGDLITMEIPLPCETSIQGEDIPLDIVYEDDDLLVVNKPKGMVVHPAPGHTTGTLVNALMHHCKNSLSGINGEIRPGIVHRIDKDTSGLLIVAKNDYAHRELARQIKEHSFKREYEAVVYGNIHENGTIDLPIGRHDKHRKKMAVTNKSARNAVTHYEVVENLDDFCHLRLKLETGRTHQIRVHMAYVGHPVAGDEVYGPKKVIVRLKGQCLHAKSIGFVHPRSGEYLEFGSQLPQYFRNFLKEVSKP